MISLEKLYRPKDRHLGGMRLLHKSFMFYLSFVMQVFNHDHILNFRKQTWIVLPIVTLLIYIDIYYKCSTNILNNSEYYILRYHENLECCVVYIVDLKTIFYYRPQCSFNNKRIVSRSTGSKIMTENGSTLPLLSNTK